MSPIESKLYEAMVAEGLTPVPQYCIQGYFADFAFPDIRLAVEAARPTTAAGRRAATANGIGSSRAPGGPLKRFHGSTIHERAGNCAFVVRREVEKARAQGVRGARERHMARERRREAVMRPFRRVVRLFRRRPKGGAGASKLETSP